MKKPGTSLRLLLGAALSRGGFLLTAIVVKYSRSLILIFFLLLNLEKTFKAVQPLHSREVHQPVARGHGLLENQFSLI
jgi:hypothetical protein